MQLCTRPVVQSYSSFKFTYYTQQLHDGHHKALNEDLQNKKLEGVFYLRHENFTINQLMPPLAKGGYINDESKENLIAMQNILFFGGKTDEKFVLNNNLDVF